MVERAAERRLAGDWRGACAAAGVDVDLDPEALRGEHGAEFAVALLDDLHHLVPDLARLHLPRFWNGSGALVPGQTALLSRPGGPEGPWLTLRPRSWKVHGDQRLVLKVDRVPLADHTPLSNRVPHHTHWNGVAHIWETSRHLWDARRTDEARERWGGSAERAAFLNPDGTLSATPVTDPGPGGDPALRTEWLEAMLREGRTVEACAAAGVALNPDEAEIEWAHPTDPVDAVETLPLALSRLAGEVRRLVAAGFGEEYRIPYSIHESVLVTAEAEGAVGLRFEEYQPWDMTDRPVLPEVCWVRPPDIDLVRYGVSPDELHPLVREAIAPARAAVDAAAPAAVPAVPGPARVRCRDGAWHTVTPTPTGLDIAHTAEERERESAMRALGGESSGCFAALDAWNTGRGRLPRALRMRRDDLFERVRHGDTDAALRYLEAGGDPDLRDRHGRTLLHHLARIDHTVVLPLLLKAGANVDAEDLQGCTPLFRAVAGSGTIELARALLRAGARAERIGTEEYPDLDETIGRRTYEDSEASLPEQAWESLLEDV
ncbi:ankyrin repeat domain-containing protein [Nocardiopsis protaetiae]|uniref:ankyrin repeat domain-containing protein n=1 Tax=Nocardiopsis protaetiae TaxID=3382270 RepID=UPI00387B40F7